MYIGITLFKTHMISDLVSKIFLIFVYKIFLLSLLLLIFFILTYPTDHTTVLTDKMILRCVSIQIHSLRIMLTVKANVAYSAIPFPCLGNKL